MAETVTTSVKLPPKLKARLKKIAAKSQRTTHWVMREAIEQYVDREDARARMHADALEALADFEKTGRHLTGDEVNAWLRDTAAGRPAKPLKPHR
ncbi:MAG: CopG family ribbon-helix-helix protein [Alphaproteobacteria bacterium]